jgi:uncharacterized membrane protein (UPF0127 family)
MRTHGVSMKTGKYARMVSLAALLFVMVFVSSSCHLWRMKKATLSINGRPLTVEIARTNKQRAHGLMFRDKLEWNEGMLFVFRKEKVLSFWMKNTKIPLSIAFIDKTGTVTDIFAMTPYSLVPVSSSTRCRYALEVNRGFFEASGLKVGDRLDLDF